MARTNGTSGVIKAAATGGTPAAVGEIKSFTLDETNETQDVTCLGDSARRRDTGLDDWTLQLEAHYDPADTAQAGLTKGAKVDIEIYPQGAAAGAVMRSGTGIISSASSANEVEGKVSYSVTIEADGPLASATVE